MQCYVQPKTTIYCIKTLLSNNSNELLAGVDGIRTPKEMPHTSSVYHLYVIQSDDRDGLQHYLEQNGVATGLHYPVPLHLQEAYSGLGYEEGDFPVAEKAAERILSLPMFPELTEVQIGYVCGKIAKFRRLEGEKRRSWEDQKVGR